MRRQCLVLLAGWALSQAALAATYYVDTNAANNSGNGSQASPKKYLQSGLGLLSSKGGDTLIIAPGTYSHERDAILAPRGGRAGAYNVIKAATDGTVRITAAFALEADDHYLQFEGLKFDRPDVKVITGRFVKILRCAFKGGPATGNTVTVQIGSNDLTPGAQNILLEDSWVYGPGGRYKILVYNADRVVLRRVLVRHDGGWSYDHNNPQAGIAIYDSTRVELQNGMVIDSRPDLPAFESNIYLVSNGTTAQRAGQVAVRGTLVIGGGGNGIAWDGSHPYASSVLEDVVVWGSSAGGIASNGSAHVGTITRATVMSGGTGFADWHGGSRLAIDHSIAYRNARSACEHVSLTQSLAYGNGANNCGTVRDPRAANGGEAGARVVKRIGVSGSLPGEPGFDQLTDEDLWPWPNEDRIKRDLAESDSRGFSASSQTLTRYVRELIGSPSPFGAAGATP